MSNASASRTIPARLAARYWDLSDPGRANVLATWERAAHDLVRIVITAEQVRRYSS